MKKSEILQKAVIIPLVAGIIIAILFFCYFKSNVEKIISVPQGMEISYFDTTEYSDSDDFVGTLEVGGKLMPVAKNADYSFIGDGAILVEGSTSFGETGCSYIKLASQNAAMFENEDSFKISTNDKEYEYKLVDTTSADSEYEMLLKAPNYNDSVIIYYQFSNGAGLSSYYKAYVFKGVS